MIHESAYIHPTAVIYDGVVIEENVYVGAYCIIGSPAEWKGREDNTGKVIIKKGSRLTGLVTVDSGTHQNTIIGENCYLLKKSHVGHDAVIGEGVILSCNSIIGGHTIIGKHCNIGLGAIIHQSIVIPPFVMIGMGGIVTKKSQVKSFNIYAGNPVKYIRENDYLVKQFQDEYSRNI